MKTITAHVTRADQAANPYYYIPFDVPEGTTRIDVAIRYAKAEDCIIDLGAFDPRDTGYPAREGFRGWSGGARDCFFIATDDATPGYIHGDMPPGIWHVILGLYKVPESGADIALTIGIDDAPRALLPQPERSFPVRAGAGWYKGDLHCHTYHSDARGSPEVLHAAARQAGLDFLAIADHNTISQRRYFHPQSSPDLVFVRGMEVTTAVGHANVFGVDEWIDFRMTRPSDAHVLERLVHEAGGLLSINHDKPVIPWDYELPAADCQEVWQSTWLDWNWVSLERYQQRLASGMKLSAIGGSDYHQPADLRPEGPLVLARPTTVLFLTELSEDAVLAAMKSGHGYITESPAGPHLELRCGDAVMGGTVADASQLDISVRGAGGDRLVLIDATGPLVDVEIDRDDWTGQISLDHPQTFVRAEIIAVASRERLIGELLSVLEGVQLPAHFKGARIAEQPLRRALSNPIYIGP
ncbi:MAG: CehA/McbA family metallohydrolase [Devosia sp.]|uniref:CehA/McbA family metallohydrolase n=1 Tax=Devosia sp. TaxID=1871048 RepID=UPI0024C97F76|nr:CehA/McbA family metallohydrolase [Devosia sp.]UYN98593.1 MAG: CehA/McbA family metallohydrolase [Devosia sp.]